MTSELPSFESNPEGSSYIYYEKALAKAEAYIQKDEWEYNVQIIKEVRVLGNGPDTSDKFLLKFIDSHGNSWNMSIEETDEYIDERLQMDIEKKFRSYPAVDPLTVETHTGNGVLERVKNILEEKKNGVVDFDARIEIAQNAIEQNKNAIDSMLADLSEEEQNAFRLALTRGLEDYYFSNYTAIKKRLDSNPFGSNQ